MSGLFARTKPAGRDGVRYARSKHIGDIRDASVIYGSSRVSTDRSFHLLRPASSWAIRRATSTGTTISVRLAWRPLGGCTRRLISSIAKRYGRTCWPRPPPPTSAAFAPVGKRARVSAYDGPFEYALAARSRRQSTSGRSLRTRARRDGSHGWVIFWMTSSADPMIPTRSRPRNMPTVDSKCKFGSLRKNRTPGTSTSSNSTSTGSLAVR